MAHKPGTNKHLDKAVSAHDITAFLPGRDKTSGQVAAIHVLRLALDDSMNG